MTPRGEGGLEQELDDLFAAEPGQFIRARDDLARRLRKAGEQDAAARVAKLRKPTAVAWALNQLSRREGGQVRALLEQDERLRALMLSAGRGDDLRKATDKRREIVRDLARLAAAVLAGAGHKATPASTEKIFETLQAVATDAEAREALRSGRLAADVRPSGFAEALPARAARPAEDGGARAVDEAREQLAEARRTARERAEEAEGLRREAERLGRAAGDAERQARRARKDADLAADKANEAGAAADEAARFVAELEENAD